MILNRKENPKHDHNQTTMPLQPQSFEHLTVICKKLNVSFIVYECCHRISTVESHGKQFILHHENTFVCMCSLRMYITIR